MNKESIDRIYRILKLSAPLILSTTGLMIMQFIDALFLAWYSPEAIAAVVPSGMAAYLIISPFQATASYTSTFVAHYVGAKRIERVYSATWQGIYFSLLAAILVFLIGFTGTMLFKMAGHAPEVARLEAIYFSILCWGAFPFLISNAVSGYFAGRGKTSIIMIVNLIGFALNGFLAYVMIFGITGIFPSMGVKGAAYATILAQSFVAITLMLFFIREESGESAGRIHRSSTSGLDHKKVSQKNFTDGDSSKQSFEELQFSWSFCKLDLNLFKRLIRFGFPSGIRWGFEMLAWTIFLFVVGRLGTIELAASNIAFRINGFAFFPVIGLSQAVAVLVGQSQGRQDTIESVRITYAGLFLSEIWMLASAFVFIVFPEEIYLLFKSDIHGNGNYEAIIKTGTILLQFIAFYSLFDALNIILSGALQAAGDTKWTMIFGLIANICFFTLLILADFYKMGLWIEWILGALFVIITGLLWLYRFQSGIWKSIKVIEHAP